MFQAGAANVARRPGRRSSGIGRGLALAPRLRPARALEGRPLDPKRTCRTFSYCTALMRSKHNALGQFAAGCPPFDKEVYGPIWDEAKATKSYRFHPGTFASGSRITRPSPLNEVIWRPRPRRGRGCGEKRRRRRETAGSQCGSHSRGRRPASYRGLARRVDAGAPGLRPPAGIVGPPDFQVLPPEEREAQGPGGPSRRGEQVFAIGRAALRGPFGDPERADRPPPGSISLELGGGPQVGRGVQAAAEALAVGHRERSQERRPHQGVGQARGGDARRQHHRRCIRAGTSACARGRARRGPGLG